MPGSATRDSFEAARAAAAGSRRTGPWSRISAWGAALLRRLGVRWVEPSAPPPDWDDAEQW